MSNAQDRTILSVTDANKSPKKPSSSDTKPSTSDPAAPDASEYEKVKSMEYHRQVLKGKLEDDSSMNKYISPSDNIMSPCTQKLSALKGKQFGKAKPKSLFAQTAGKNAGAGTDGGNPFTTRNDKGDEKEC